MKWTSSRWCLPTTYAMRWTSSRTCGDEGTASSLLGLDFDLVELEPAAAQPVAVSEPRVNVASPVFDVLGFDVQYGTPTEEDAPAPADSVIARPTSTRIPTPVTTPVGPSQGTPFAPMPSIPYQGATQTTAAANDITSRFAGSPGSSVASSMSNANEAHAESDGETHASGDARLTLAATDDGTRDRRIRRPNIRAGRATTPRSSRGFLIAGAVTAALSAVAGWMILAR